MYRGTQVTRLESLRRGSYCVKDFLRFLRLLPEIFLEKGSFVCVLSIKEGENDPVDKGVDMGKKKSMPTQHPVFY